MAASFVRVRGRVVQAVRFAWLESGGSWACSVPDTSFEVVTADGARVRVRTDPSTEWSDFQQRYVGPASELEEYDAQHPFRDRVPVGGVDYRALAVPEDAGVEVWGAPSYAAGESSYRETRPGDLESVVAARVSRHEAGDERPAPLTRWAIALAVLAVAGALAAPFVRLPFLLARVALLAGLAALRRLHFDASPFGPSIAVKRPLLRELGRVLFWAYLVIGYLMPVQERTFRVGAGVVVALACAYWALTTRRGRAPVVGALLGPAALEGIVDAEHVRTETVTLTPDAITVRWTERLYGWMEIARDSMAQQGLVPSDGRHALVAPLPEGKPAWAMVQSFTPSIRATLERARPWDRAMPIVYLALGVAAIALSWWQV